MLVQERRSSFLERHAVLSFVGAALPRIPTQSGRRPCRQCNYNVVPVNPDV
jgi:hypothetical protein